MAKFAEHTGLDDRLQKHAASWYDKRRIPETFRNQPAKLIDTVEKLCEGDWRRCVLDFDNSIVIYNSPQWEPE